MDDSLLVQILDSRCLQVCALSVYINSHLRDTIPVSIQVIIHHYYFHLMSGMSTRLGERGRE